MARKLGKRSEVALRTRISRGDFKDRATGQAIKFQLGLEQRQRTIQATGVELSVTGLGPLYSVRHLFSPGRHIESR